MPRLRPPGALLKSWKQDQGRSETFTQPGQNTQESLIFNLHHVLTYCRHKLALSTALKKRL